MQVSDFIRDDLVVLDLKASSKEDAIRQLTQRLHDVGAVRDVEDFFREVMEREKLGTTAVGHGVSLPHARTEKLDDIVVAMGRCNNGVDFGAEDGQPVKLIFLIGTPLKEVNRYLKLLAGLSRMLRRKEVRHALLAARNAEEVRKAMEDVHQEV